MTLYQKSVRSLGHEPTCAASGQAGLEAAAGQRFDFVISDFNMPEMNGDEMLATMREQGTLPPRVLVTTGDPGNQPVIKALALPNCRCLMKPVLMADLKTAIQHLLEIADRG